MNRAYSVLEVKATRDDERVIEGIASTPTPDRYGDIVDPLGAKFAVPMPLLWQHRAAEPIGQVEFAKPKKDGIPFRARLLHPDKVESQLLKERLQLAWDSIKAGLVRAVSIGFAPIEWSFLKEGGIHFQEWEWLELSAVTIPANAEATISNIKAIDAEVLRGIPPQEDRLEAAARDAMAVDEYVAGLNAISAEPKPAAPGLKAHVVKLNPPPAPGRPLVINKIHHTR